mmetsp:Transcript_62118/g.115236  ORF Transcript_62118/g.115236 Transcript_62118/m.115236 type:complete len:519 (-) Transcript_62118:56-1612(-)
MVTKRLLLKSQLRSHNATVNAMVKQRQWREALHMVGTMREQLIEPSVVTFNTLVQPLLASEPDAWRRSLAILATMLTTASRPDAITYTGVMNTCERASYWKYSVGVYEAAVKTGMLPDIGMKNGLLMAYAAGSAWRAALSALFETRRAKDIVTLADVVSFSVTMTAFSTASQWDLALVLLQTMVQQTVLPNEITYTTLIGACETGSEWQGALSLLCNMRSRGFLTNAIGCTRAIGACAEGQQWTVALDLLHGMIKTRVEPNPMTFTNTASACERSSQWQHAVELTNVMRMLTCSPNYPSCNSILSACAKSSAWRSVFNIVDNMVRQELPPDYITCRVLGSACQAGERWAEALMFLKASSTMVAVDELAAAGFLVAVRDGCGLAVATEVFAEWRINRPEQCPLRPAARLQLWAQALQLLSDGLTARLFPEEIVDKYQWTMDACVKAIMWQQALDMLNTMHTAQLQPGWIGEAAAVEACARAGEQGIANAIFRSASTEQAVWNARKGKRRDGYGAYDSTS